MCRPAPPSALSPVPIAQTTAEWAGICGTATVKLASFSEGGPILAAWDYVPRTHRPVTVLPNGCRDLIVQCDPATGARGLMLSGLDAIPQTVNLPAGQRLAGLRLRAGVTLPSWLIDELRRELVRPSGDAEPDLVGQAIATDAELNDDLLGAITAGRTVLRAARLLRVSERTLHRRMIARTGRAPHSGSTLPAPVGRWPVCRPA